MCSCNHKEIDFELERRAELIRTLTAQLAEANARVRRLSGILTGATRQETADKIFAAVNGRMKTRSVWIPADELMQPLPAPPEEKP